MAHLNTPRPQLTTSARAARLSLVLAATVAAAQAQAQGVQRVDVTAPAFPAVPAVSGFDAPLARTPIQATVVDEKLLKDLGGADLTALTRLDAGVSDAYNSTGYWTFLTVRGFVIDNQQNYRRDGLPINAETALPLADKSQVNVLKGTSGAQAGVSAPGGLVDLVVKRPDADLARITLYAEGDGTAGTSLDWSRRFGANKEFGLRINADLAKLDPPVHDLPGHRHLLAAAADWRPTAATLVEVEWEHSNQSERSQPGFSLLGDTLPDPKSIDPRTNLNDQPWSLPVVLQGNTGSIRVRQQLGDAWTAQLHAGTQRLVSNDRVAFPYGLYDPDTYACNPCDRYAADGTYSIWDFRSEDERRRTDALDASVDGKFATGPVTHAASFGVTSTRFTGRFNDEAYNLVGVGTIDGRTIVPADPTLTTPNTDRTERSTEFYARDHADLAEVGALWLGVRHTRLHRETTQTPLGDPAQSTDYTQSFTTPWLALSHQFNDEDAMYASWGEGIETALVPSVGGYADGGKPLTAQRSRQWEAGWKHAGRNVMWGLDWFDIKQPFAGDLTTDPSNPTYGDDGITHAHGLEAEIQGRTGAWTWRASWLRMRATREDAHVLADQNGLRPANVPERALKAMVGYDIAAIPGLHVSVAADHQGNRAVLPDDSVNIPAWTSWDLGARYVLHTQAATYTLRAGVDNATDHRAWREAPYQYGHAYLFPLAPRTWRLSFETLL